MMDVPKVALIPTGLYSIFVQDASSCQRLEQDVLMLVGLQLHIPQSVKKLYILSRDVEQSCLLAASGLQRLCCCLQAIAYWACVHSTYRR